MSVDLCSTSALLFLRSYFIMINGLRKIENFAIVTDHSVSDLCLRDVTTTLVEEFRVPISNYVINVNGDDHFHLAIHRLSDLARDSLTLQILMVGTWTTVNNVLFSMKRFRYLCEFRNWWSILSDGSAFNSSDFSFVRDCQMVSLEVMSNNGYRLTNWGQKPYLDEYRWNDLGSWNSESGFSLKRNVFSVTLKERLKEKFFRVTMEKHFPFFIPDENGQMNGIDFKLIKGLRDGLKFNYKIVRPPDGRWGSLENGTWVGMIGQVSRKGADMALGGMTVTEKRMEEVTFSNYYSHDRVTFATRAPIGADRTWDIILPFSWKVWITLVAAVFFTSGVLTAIEYAFCNFTFVPQFEGETKPDSISYSEALFYMYQALVFQDSYETRRSGSRIVITTWWIFTMTVMAGYSGLLVSFMTCPRTEEPLDTIAKLVTQLKNRNYQCGTIKDSSDHNIFKGAKSEQFQIVLKSMESKMSNFVKRDLDGLEKCRNENYAYIAGELTVLADMKNPSLYVFGKDSFRPSGYGIAFRKDFWYTELFNLWIHKLFEAGIIDNWSRTLIEKAQNAVPMEDDSIRPLAFREVQGSIVVHLLGCLAAIVLMVSNVILRYAANKSKLAWKRSRDKIKVIENMKPKRLRTETDYPRITRNNFV